MSYIDHIFSRLDVQHIREFLLHGKEEKRISPLSYYERIHAAEKEAIEMLQSKFSDQNEIEQITTPVLDYVAATQEAYMEIGIQCGFVLATQIFSNAKAAPDKQKSFF